MGQKNLCYMLIEQDLMCERRGGRRYAGSVGNPALKCCDRKHPTECDAGHCYGEIEEKHHII